MRTIEGSFAVITYGNRFTPHMSFIFKNPGENIFIQYTTSLNEKITCIEDFKISTPILVREVIKKNKTSRSNNNVYSGISLGKYNGIKNVLQNSEVIVFTSNIIPGQWKLFSRLVNQNNPKSKEYYIVRME